MWLGGHMQVGWFVGWAAGLGRRERTALAWCGALPDVDALTRLGGVDAYLAGHHVYLHNVWAAALLPVCLAPFTTRRRVAYALGVVTIALHIVSDGYGLLAARRRPRRDERGRGG